MKAIKKIVAVVAIATAVSAASFAVDYSGDVQLQLGWQGATTKVGIIVDDMTFQSNAFYIGVQNWNLWNINDLFSVGFFDKLDFGIGGGSKVKVAGVEGDYDYTRFAVNFLIGPAIGIRAGNIAKFQIGMGFVGGYEGLKSKDNDGTMGNGVIGFGVDLQAKFLPHLIISPLVGFQYAFRGASEYVVTDGDGKNSITVSDSINAHSYALYVGGSFNFGRR